MVQTIEAKVAIPIPDKFELIETDKLDNLRSQAVTGRTWTMEGLRNWIGRKQVAWIKDNILFNPQYADEIQRMRDKREIVGGGRGSQYHFKASAMAAFIERHHSELNWEG